MIIGMNYDNEGERHIIRLTYGSDLTREQEQTIADGYKTMYDEVYILDSYMDNTPLSDYIVTKGCRV